jgi:hypothetical protein
VIRDALDASRNRKAISVRTTRDPARAASLIHWVVRKVRARRKRHHPTRPRVARHDRSPRGRISPVTPAIATGAHSRCAAAHRTLSRGRPDGSYFNPPNCSDYTTNTSCTFSPDQITGYGTGRWQIGVSARASTSSITYEVTTNEYFYIVL